MNKKTKITVSELTPHPDVIEIRPVNEMTVSSYRQFMRRGDKFPPLVIDGQNQVVCGNHRLAAYAVEFGEDRECDCITVDFADTADLIEYAIKDNQKHGRQLDGITKRRAAIKLARLGRTEENLATLFGIPVKRVVQYGEMTVLVVGGNRRSRPEPKPIKRGLEHLHGTTITKDAYEQHIRSDRGIKSRDLAKQLARHIRNGWVDMTDEQTAHAIEELREAMEIIFGHHHA